MDTPDWLTLENICQVTISCLGLAALILVTYKNKWGFPVGLVGQPFWFITSYNNQQWGIFVLSVAYTITWSWGTYTWFFGQFAAKDSSRG